MDMCLKHWVQLERLDGVGHYFIDEGGKVCLSVWSNWVGFINHVRVLGKYIYIDMQSALSVKDSHIG